MPTMDLDRLVVRTATAEDCHILKALEQKVIDAERPFNPAIKVAGVCYYDIEFLHNDESSRLVVGEVAGTILATGYVQLRVSKSSLIHDRHGYLGFMYVSEAYRRRGVNKIILQDLVDWGEAQGVTDFYLDVYAANHSAVRAYENFGFRSSLLEMKLDTRTVKDST